MIWKIWEGGLDPDITYYIRKDSMDEALAEVRKMNPKVNTAQPCTEEEERELTGMRHLKRGVM